MSVRGHPLPAFLLTSLAVLFLPHTSVADSTATGIVNYRVAKAPNKYDDTYLVGIALHPRAGIRWQPELAAAVIRAPDKTRPLVSIGPMWCINSPGRDLSLRVGIAPTLIAGATLDGKDLGGNFHFTSSVALGARLGVQEAWLVAVRFQHMSNASLRRPNPGLNLLGLDFSYRFAGP